MLNRDNLFDAMSGVRDEYLSSAADLLGYQQEETDMHFEQKAKRTGLRKTGRILLIAAVIACLFTVTAFAAGLSPFRPGCRIRRKPSRFTGTTARTAIWSGRTPNWC